MLKEFLKDLSLYNRACVTKSFSAIMNRELKYKRHFFFKCLPEDRERFTDKFNGRVSLNGCDVFSNGWGIAESVFNKIDFSNIPTIKFKQVKKIFTLFGSNKLSDQTSSPNGLISAKALPLPTAARSSSSNSETSS